MSHKILSAFCTLFLRCCGNSILGVLIFCLACQGGDIEMTSDGRRLSVDDFDAEHNRAATVSARHFVLNYHLDLSGQQRFTRYAPKEEQLIDALSRRGERQLTLYSIGTRSLIVLPADHPVGQAELLLADDQDALVAFWPEKKLRYIIPREQLIDFMDRSGNSSCHDFKLELETDSAAYSKGSMEPYHRTRAYQAKIFYHYFPEQGKPLDWSMLLQLHFTVNEELPDPVFRSALFALALPLPHSYETMGLFESLAYRTGRPIALTLTINNKGRASNTLAPRFQIQVDDHGYQQLFLSRFSTSRTGYRESRYRPFPDSTGQQLLNKNDLAMIRRPMKSDGPVSTSTMRVEPAISMPSPARITPPADRDSEEEEQRSVTDTPRGLDVQNRSRIAAYVYADGLLLGWVAPGQQLSFFGLPERYYRIYATSPTGLHSWGSFDIYVPGPVILGP